MYSVVLVSITIVLILLIALDVNLKDLSLSFTTQIPVATS